MKLLGLALLLICWTVLGVAAVNCVLHEILEWQDRRDAKGWWLALLVLKGSIWRTR